MPASFNIEMEPAGNRFAHLLRPIRDLSENWSIDIAKYLEDYLQEVIILRCQRNHVVVAQLRLKELPFLLIMVLIT